MTEKHLPAGLRPLLDAAAIHRRVAELAAEIDRDYAGRDPLLVVVMKGALVFAADLLRCLRSDLRLDFIAVSSYRSGTEPVTPAHVVSDLQADVRGEHVLVVEDILDTGLTLKVVLENIRACEPASLEVCTLLSKPARHRTEIAARYVGFEIDDVFVVGYGLDHAERFRGLPYIALLPEDQPRE